MTQLSLDDVERHALAGELERMRVTELVRREPAPHRRSGGKAAELDQDPGGRPGPPRFGPSITQRNGSQLCPANGPLLSRLGDPAFVVTMVTDADSLQAEGLCPDLAGVVHTIGPRRSEFTLAICREEQFKATRLTFEE